MSLTNLTPLPCLPMDTLTPDGRRLGVVLVKLTLDLVPAGPELRARGFTHALKLSQEQSPLAVTDSYHGEFLHSSVRLESDVAPPKPRCDVIFLGDAHAPGPRPCRRFLARLRVSAPDRERPEPIPGEILLDKRLQVTGERWLRRRRLPVRAFWFAVKLLTLGLVRRCPWRLTRPRPLAVLPLRYEYAFGGHARVRASEPGFRKVPRRAWLPGVDRARLRQAWKQDRTDGLLAEAFWPANPAGRGYAPLWQLKATRARRLPAPQIEDPACPFTARAAWRVMTGRAAGRFRPQLAAQGMGVIPRNCPPRLDFAGTWDAAWAASGAPYPPDYDPAFANCAHPDLQCRHLEGVETVELTNLAPHDLAGLVQGPRGERVLRFRLPGLFPFLMLDPGDGVKAQVPAVLDTLILEPGAGRVTLVQRASFPAEPEAAIELRLAMPWECREQPGVLQDRT